MTEEVLESESLLIEKLFLGLRLSTGFNFNTVFSKELGKIEELIDLWKNQKYITDDSNIELTKLTPLGYLMCDSLIDDIFKKVDF